MRSVSEGLHKKIKKKCHSGPHIPQGRASALVIQQPGHAA